LFISELRATGGNVTLSCEIAGISKRAAYDWRESDVEFAADWNEAVESGTEDLESEARRRALIGVDEPVFYQGEACGTVKKYSDTLLIFLLKGRRPDKYRDNVTIKVEDVDRAIESELAKLAATGKAGDAPEVEGESVH
jgi:hypothetical protein